MCTVLELYQSLRLRELSGLRKKIQSDTMQLVKFSLKKWLYLCVLLIFMIHTNNIIINSKITKVDTVNKISRKK